MKKMKLDSFGVMLDVSRNNVISIEGYKRMFPILQKMGYNTVFLYMEDTYEVEGEPYFGYMRGRYSIDEMKEIDAIGAEHGIEVIPCIQTLAHLNTIFKWRNKFPMDSIGTLMVGDDRTYELIENMFKTLRKCFRTDRLHVGMDEAYMLGRGKYLDKYGYETVPEIMKKHLEKVAEIGKKYNYELLMWSDMFFNGWTEDKYNTAKAKIPQEYIDAIPDSILPVYWNYYTRGTETYDDMLYNHKQLNPNLWFAGGAWTWTGFVPDNKFSIDTMSAAFEACRKYKVKNIFVTLWGDNGGECCKLAVLPTLFYLSELAKGNDDEAKIKAKFKRTFGMEFDDFMAIDKPNQIFPGKEPIKHPKTPAKYMLFSDYFNAHLDSTVGKGGNEIYAEMEKELSAVARKSRRFGYIFETAAKLCRVLSVKYELGVKTRAAYQAGDKEALLALATEDYNSTLKNLKAFYKAFKAQWMHDNKPTGFEVQEARIGAITLRTESCRDRILDYVSGKIDRIPELEGEILPFEGDNPGESIFYNGFNPTFSSNVM